MIVVVLPALVIVHYLKENRIVNFPKLNTGNFRRPVTLSGLLSLLVIIPFIMIYKFSFLISAGLIVMFAIMILPFVTFYTSKGKEITFDSNKRSIPKYGKLNSKRRTLGSLFLLLFLGNIIAVYLLETYHVPLDIAATIYFFGVAAVSMLLSIYFTSIIECEYCSCLNFKGMTKACKHCSIPFENNVD